MHALVKINQYREQKDGTDLVVSVPDLKLGDMFQNFNPRSYKRSDGKNAQLSLYLSVIIIA